jgi:hypothetical protein
VRPCELQLRVSAQRLVNLLPEGTSELSDQRDYWSEPRRRTSSLRGLFLFPPPPPPDVR